MKNGLAIARLSLPCLLLCWLTVGCNDTPTVPASPSATCRIQQSENSTGKTTYSYDAQGRLLTWNLAGTGGFVTQTATYTYDTDGYLTTSTIVSTDRSGQTARQAKTSVTFSYANGRLSGYVAEKTPGSSQGLKTTGTFVYDAAGKLTAENAKSVFTSDPASAKEPYSFSDGYEQRWTYSDNLLVDYSAKNNGQTTRPYTIVNGLITQTNGQPAFDYDSQRRLLKGFIYNEDKTLNSYYVQTWDTGKSYQESLPAFKGFPAVNPVTGTETNLRNALSYQIYERTGNPKTYAFYYQDKTNTVYKLTDITYDNQLNSQGFVVKITTNGSYASPGDKPQTETFSTTYTYTGCN
jgi:YD repeat-containing protein